LSTQSYTITLYIDPVQGGPVTPLEIDLMEIENEVLDPSVPSTNRDQLRVSKIAERIKDRFKDVDPYAKLHELTFLIGRLGHIAIFNGIALRLPGTIEADSSGSHPDPKPDPTVTVEDYDRLSAEVKKLGNELADCAHNLQKAELELKKEQSINDPLVQERKKAVEEAIVLRTSLSNFKMDNDLLKTEVERYKTKVQLLERDKADLSARLEQVLQERQRLQQSLQDLATLRRDMASKNSTEKQLRMALEQREKDLKACREQMRTIANQASKNTFAQDEDPWLDS
jgi:hypothetical protein